MVNESPDSTTTVSPPETNVNVPPETKPVCSWGWLCSGTVAPGSISKRCRLVSSPAAARRRPAQYDFAKYAVSSAGSSQIPQVSWTGSASSSSGSMTISAAISSLMTASQSSSPHQPVLT